MGQLVVTEIDEHVKFYIRDMPAIDVAYFCKKFGYEMHIEDGVIWIQKVDEVKE